MKRKAEDLPELGENGAQSNHGRSWMRGPMIGKGSFGSVFLASSRKPRSRFCCFPPLMAVKSAEVSVSGSLQKEKEVLCKIPSCPQVVRCYGEETTTSENGDMVYNVLLEYASGGTLADLIAKSVVSGLPESDVRRYTRFVLKGLRHVHEFGFVHCDLKPQNILLVPAACVCDGDEPKFVAKICDFGLARSVNQAKKRRIDPYLRGTAQYMAPEAIVDGTQEAPSDIWALGCVVLEMLTGNEPWGVKKEDLLNEIGYGRGLPDIPAAISRDCRAFLKACLVRKAKFRLTAEMLLDHPFIASLGDEDRDDDRQFEMVEEGIDAEKISSSLCHSDDELSSSCFSDDCGFISDEDSSYCSSWSGDDQELDETSNGFVRGDGKSTVGTVKAPSNTTKKFSAAFVIPAGA